jgi:hypothetical protein
MTIKYRPDDDGKTIDGKIVVWVKTPGAVGGSAEDAEAKRDADTGAKLDAETGAKRNADTAAKRGGGGVAKPGGKASARTAAVVARSQAATLVKAAADGKPFCEHCEKARQELAAAEEQ